jgi:two-component system NtrC family sensor kinase
LLGNARQAIESQGHGGTIRVRTRTMEDDRVRLEVTDSGPGIPESILPRIFDPFFTTKPAGVGTGLGLSIVLSLVREHGGQVHATSPRGGGAEFIVEFPAADQREVRSASIRTSELADASYAPPRFWPSGKGGLAPRVLIVEDEPTVAQLVADVLRDEGFETEVHLDGRDAAARAASEPFDLIICDMKMPNLDGQNLYDAVQNTRKNVARRFLFVTGDVLGAKTHEFLNRHQLPHVAKPFRVEELLEKVHQVLQPAGGAGTRKLTTLRKNSATTG